MEIAPQKTSFGELFDDNRTFEVPKYQRGYAWEERSIEDFLNDINICLEFRESGTPKTHFFGGIVALQNNDQAPLSQNFEVIDGQQRLASVVMLVLSVIKCMNGIITELNERTVLNVDEENLKESLENDIGVLKRKYIVRAIVTEREHSEVYKLNLSRADDRYFKDIAVGNSTNPMRDSHKRILLAHQMCSEFVSERLNGHCPTRKTELLRKLAYKVLEEDCEVVFMRTDSKSEAYQVFQVLNNRGVQLADGDLLRASTLKRLYRNSAHIQNQVSEYWDQILSYPTNDIDRYLKWCYTSYEGERPVKHDFARQFIERRFSCADEPFLSVAEAEKLLHDVEQLYMDVKTIHALYKGEWPFSERSTVREWDRKRLFILAYMLRHTNAIPLLLSLCEVGEVDLSKAVAVIERTVFRYKTIGNAHIDRLTKLYNKFAQKTRCSGRLSLSELRNELNELVIDANVEDSVFKPRIEALKYVVRGSNREMRYLLTTLEEYYQWYEAGASGIPKCNDRLTVFDYKNTTIEHIYPQKAKESEKDQDLESVKHMVGNLTILGPEENNRFANKTTEEKLELFSESNLRVNRKIAEYGTWTKEIVLERTTKIADMAAMVFVP